MDIETINYKGKQFPIAISTAYINKFKTKVCKIFLTDNIYLPPYINDTQYSLLSIIKNRIYKLLKRTKLLIKKIN